MRYDLAQSIFCYGKADIIPAKEKLPSLLIKLSSSSITVGNRQTGTKFGLPFLKFASLTFDSGLTAYLYSTRSECYVDALLSYS